MNDLIIYGAGGFGRETALLINQINSIKKQWNLIGFVDDAKLKGDFIDDLPVYGSLEELNQIKKPISVTIAIAHPATRRKVRDSIHGRNISFPALIHPTVLLGDAMRNVISEGVIIGAGSILTTNIVIHPFSIINLSVTIGHDTTIGAYSSIMPACSLSGFVTIGNEVLLGTGAKILPNVHMGDCSIAGAGAVVINNVPSGVTVVGVPARQIRE
jgi:sugar O-acyltransferase (sialic acid O-acetyltransferase NeuD family)